MNSRDEIGQLETLSRLRESMKRVEFLEQLESQEIEKTVDGRRVLTFFQPGETRRGVTTVMALRIDN